MKYGVEITDNSTNPGLFLEMDNGEITPLTPDLFDFIIGNLFRVSRGEFFDMAKEEFTMDNFIALKEQEARQEERKQGIQILISSLKDLNLSKENIVSQLQKRYNLTREEALSYLNK